jgi:DNA transposition AAA+ family ATPase
LFIPHDEKFQDGKFKETSSSVQLREVLSPQAKANSYFMITGEHGIGKSSASTHGADMLGHKGVVHVEVPRSGELERRARTQCSDREHSRKEHRITFQRLDN